MLLKGKIADSRWYGDAKSWVKVELDDKIPYEDFDFEGKGVVITDTLPDTPNFDIEHNLKEGENG